MMPTTTPERLDLAGEKCPLNYVRTKLRLESLVDGAVLEVVLDPGEAVQNVPRSATSDGHEVLAVEARADGRWLVRIRNVRSRGADGR